MTRWTRRGSQPVTTSDRGGERALRQGPTARTDGSPLNIFATLAHHPALLRRWLVFATHVFAKNSLPQRDRELLILRTGWRCRRSTSSANTP